MGNSLIANELGIIVHKFKSFLVEFSKAEFGRYDTAKTTRYGSLCLPF